MDFLYPVIFFVLIDYKIRWKLYSKSPSKLKINWVQKKKKKNVFDNKSERWKSNHHKLIINYSPNIVLPPIHFCRLPFFVKLKIPCCLSCFVFYCFTCSGYVVPNLLFCVLYIVIPAFHILPQPQLVVVVDIFYKCICSVYNIEQYEDLLDIRRYRKTSFKVK